MEVFYPTPERECLGVSPHAHVHESTVIGPGTNVHPGVVIGPNVTIGRDCDIHPGVCIGADCSIGDECALYPNVVLYDRVELRNRVRIHASTVLGADGFGYRQVDGRHVKIPHYGNVLIEDDVEIGSCTTIDRSFMGSTRIGAGSKIDNLVVIAHNCELGKHNILVSQVGFAGSVTTGDYVVCAGQVGIADHVHLGTGSVFGAKCGVHKSMPAGQRFIGAPAEVDRDFLKQTMAVKKLPELRQQVKALEAQMLELQARLETGLSEQKVA
jgi:UDP-3-O-[3-hydroxymyristoyl] glucosamine N-acyltransferase